MGSFCSQRAVRGSYSRAPTWYSPVKGIYSYPYAPFHRNGCSIRWAGGLMGLSQLS